MPNFFAKKPETAVLVVLLVTAVLFFALTDPARLPPAAFMVAFALLTGILYCLVRLIARLMRLKDRLSPTQYTGLIFGATVLPVLLIALQSLGQLTGRDAVTLLIIFAMGYFYVSRMSARR